MKKTKAMTAAQKSLAKQRKKKREAQKGERPRVNKSVFVPTGKKNKYIIAARDMRGEVRIYESNSSHAIIRIAAELKKGGMEILFGWGE